MHGGRCDNAVSQHQLQRHFEAQFLHKPEDLKVKLKHKLFQQQLGQGQGQGQGQRQKHAGQEAAELQWTNCMPAARPQDHLSRHAAGDLGSKPNSAYHCCCNQFGVIRVGALVLVLFSSLMRVMADVIMTQPTGCVALLCMQTLSAAC